MTVSVMAGLPTVALEGAMEMSSGIRLVTVKLSKLEVPPPAPGVSTETCDVPDEIASGEGTTADNWMELTKVVASGPPFHSIWEVEVKFEPFATRVKAVLVVTTLSGEIEDRTGAELCEPPPPPPGPVLPLPQPIKIKHNKSPGASEVHDRFSKRLLHNYPMCGTLLDSRFVGSADTNASATPPSCS
jgi:hypothetical protein